MSARAIDVERLSAIPDTITRYLPRNREVAAAARKGIEREDALRLHVEWIKPGTQLEVRLLPGWFAERKYVARLAHHWWHDAGCACPQFSSPGLLTCPPFACPACEAGVPLTTARLVYGLKKYHGCDCGCAVAFPEKYWPALRAIIAAGALDFQNGYWLGLRAVDRNSLVWTAGAIDRASSQDFETACEAIHARPGWTDPQRLRQIAAAYTAWLKAGKPEPERGRHRELVRLLPGCTLLPITWGFKAPHQQGWQHTPLTAMSDPEHLDRLDGGNIGLLCGHIPGTKTVLVGLDADSDEFAQELSAQNPWLEETFCVRGGRGCKWFFKVRCNQRQLIACQQPRIIYRAGEHAGEWLANHKQGVVHGLHPPSGKFYLAVQRKVILEVEPSQFALPPGYELSRPEDAYVIAVRARRRAMGGDDDRPSLDLKKLRQLAALGNGGWQAQCPACAEEGLDTGGDNLRIYPNKKGEPGAFVCARFISSDGEDKHEHNRAIYRLNHDLAERSIEDEDEEEDDADLTPAASASGD